MEKTAQRKTYKDPALNKIIQEKAAWNKQVSALINDLIHFKKSMNGWPSKYYKERTRITQPAPIDLSGILNQIAGDFQDIASRGNGILQEQSAFSKGHLKRKTEQALSRLERARGPAEGPAKPPTPPTPPPGGAVDLTKQLGGAVANSVSYEMIKLAAELEDKYLLEAQASNPFTRFITRLFTPKFGFGEGARIRRLRMTMLDSCVKAYKELKRLQTEAVKSSKASVVNSHKMMTTIFHHWNTVYRLLSTFRILKPGKVTEQGGQIDDPELKKEKAIEEGWGTAEEDTGTPSPGVTPEQAGLGGVLGAPGILFIIQDYRNSISSFPPLKSPALHALHLTIESITAASEKQRADVASKSNIGTEYADAIREINAELGTTGTNLKQIATQLQSKGPVSKEAQLQRWVGKTRHQLLPGATSGPRLEIYRLIDQTRRDMNTVMDLLEKGFDQEQLTSAINQVHREMINLRVMIRSLYSAEKPELAGTPFF